MTQHVIWRELLNIKIKEALIQCSDVSQPQHEGAGTPSLPVPGLSHLCPV